MIILSRDEQLLGEYVFIMFNEWEADDVGWGHLCRDGFAAFMKTVECADEAKKRNLALGNRENTSSIPYEMKHVFSVKIHR